MKLSALKIGQILHYPPDSGATGGTGRVAHIGAEIQENLHGVKFVWVSLRCGNSSAGVWPSNRLGVAVDS